MCHIVPGCEIYVLKQRDIRRLKTAEMKFKRSTAGYSSLDPRRNEGILEQVKIDPVEKKLAQYKQKYLNYVSRIEDIRYPKQLFCGDLEDRKRD
jgi:hypothetical protein